MTNVIRDAQVHPLTREMAEPYYQHWEERMRYVLATGWGVEDERLALLLAALGHALDFQTWRSLAREQGLDDGQAVGLMVNMVRHTRLKAMSIRVGGRKPGHPDVASRRMSATRKGSEATTGAA